MGKTLIEPTFLDKIEFLEYGKIDKVMNRLILVLSVIVIALLLVASCNTPTLAVKNDSDIRQIAYGYISVEEQGTISDWEHAPVELYHADTRHAVTMQGSIIDITGKDTIKVTFYTVDALLGPITVYIDKTTYEVLQEPNANELRL
jgi:hypothetical protein